MSNDNKTLADMQPGGRVMLGNQAERARFEAWGRTEGLPLARAKLGGYAFEVTAKAWLAWQHLSAQPSPGVQVDVLAAAAQAVIEAHDGADFITDAQVESLRAALAARHPVGEPVIWVSPGQLAAHKDRVPGDGGAYLSARLTRDGQFTKPLYATPAQAVDLDAMRALLQRRIEQWRSHLPADPGAPGTREIETKGEHDYNNDVRIYREGIAVMEEVLSKIDGQAVGNG